MTLHLADDARISNGGMGARGPANIATVLVLLVWLIGTLLLAERKSGQVIMLLRALLGFAMPVIHRAGTGGIVGASMAGTTRAFYFVWVTLLVGVISSGFAGILAARALLRPSEGTDRGAA